VAVSRQASANEIACRRRIEAALIVALVILVAIGHWRVALHDADSSVVLVRRPRGVMGTDCVLAAVVAQGDKATAEAALDAAEALLRQVEARMSNWLDVSEVSQLGAAEAGVLVPLSPDTLAVLTAAREAFDLTGQTFDATCRPQVELWRRAGETAILPDVAAVAEARAASRWEDLDLTDSGVVKRTSSACVDLGGIAKGYGIDLALRAMQRSGLRGGLVDVGTLQPYHRPSHGLAGGGRPLRHGRRRYGHRRRYLGNGAECVGSGGIRGVAARRRRAGGPRPPKRSAIGLYARFSRTVYRAARRGYPRHSVSSTVV
jgi:hypothetical protein